MLKQIVIGCIGAVLALALAIWFTYGQTVTAHHCLQCGAEYYSTETYMLGPRIFVSNGPVIETIHTQIYKEVGCPDCKHLFCDSVVHSATGSCGSFDFIGDYGMQCQPGGRAYTTIVDELKALATPEDRAKKLWDIHKEVNGIYSN